MAVVLLCAIFTLLFLFQGVENICKIMMPHEDLVSSPQSIEKQCILVQSAAAAAAAALSVGILHCGVLLLQLLLLFVIVCTQAIFLLVL